MAGTLSRFPFVTLAFLKVWLTRDSWFLQCASALDLLQYAAPIELWEENLALTDFS